MARLFTGGGELYAGTAGGYLGFTEGKGEQSSGTVTRDTSIKRSGNASVKCSTTAGTGLACLHSQLSTASAVIFTRHYFLAEAPSAECDIIWFDSGAWKAAPTASVRLNTDRTIELWVFTGGVWTQSGSASVDSLDTTNWKKIEVNITVGVTDSVILRLDDVEVATWSGDFTNTASTQRVSAGWVTTPGATSLDIWVDDYACNNSIGSVQDSWCGSGRVLVAIPESDNQDGSWTGGSGTVPTDMFEAINNLPPAGTNSEDNTTQIESADSSGNNATDELRTNLQSYVTAGLRPSVEKVTVLHSICIHGEDVTTNTKTGSFGVNSNPAVSLSNFTYGDDSGGLGAFPTGWKEAIITTYNPSIDAGVSPVMAVRKTDAGTRVASVCFMGLMFEANPLPPHIVHTPYKIAY